MYVLNDFKDLANTLFPRFCPLCGKRLKSDEIICTECKKKIDPLPYRESLRGKWFFDDFYYRAAYKGIMGKLIKVYKFVPRPSLAEFLAEGILEIFERFPPLPGSVLTYVPPTFKSLKEKGFDHMKTLAKQLSKKSGLPLYILLEVKKQKGYQVGLSQEERREQIRSKYMVLSENLYRTSGKVILIDDVFTTGATVNECSRILKLAGASHVSVYTLAKS